MSRAHLPTHLKIIDDGGGQLYNTFDNIKAPEDKKLRKFLGRNDKAVARVR